MAKRCAPRENIIICFYMQNGEVVPLQDIMSSLKRGTGQINLIAAEPMFRPNTGMSSILVFKTGRQIRKASALLSPLCKTLIPLQ